MWAWANEAFPENLRTKSAQLKQLAEITGFDIFHNEMAEVDQDMAWEISSMALSLLSYEGVYRAPANKTQYFYALTNVEKVNA